MKSQVFNIKRFGKLFTTELALNFKTNWISLMIAVFFEVIAVITGVTISFCTTGEIQGYGEINRIFSFIVFLALLVLVFPCKFYRHVNDPESGPAYLMLPASRLEKYISMILNTLVILPAVCISIFLGIDALICLIPDSGAWLPKLLEFPDLDFIVHGGDGTRLSPIRMADDLISIILVFLLGTIWFQGAKVPKTFLAYVVISMVLGLTMLITKAIIGIDNSEVLGWTLQHTNHVNIISNLTTIVILLTALWFRLKNLKL